MDDPASGRDGHAAARPHTAKAPSKGANFQVAVRVRPRNARERGARTCVAVQGTSVIRVLKNADGSSNLDRGSSLVAEEQTHAFAYDRVFGETASQQELYVEVVRPVVLSVLEGYNGSIIAYGQTGTGKTHTIEGELEGDQRGIIPRSAAEVFDYIHEDTQDASSQWLVRVSYLQIYNERISDLLADSRDNLRIRESGDGSVYVEDLSEHVVRNPRDVYRLLQHGKTQRATNSTKFNKASSRSHAVFTLTIEHSHSDGISENPDVTVGKLHLVDLAGSERYEATEVEKHQKETQNINLSLTAFGKVVLALTSRSHVSHVPYRESKLTRILQDSLGGNCRTAMITTISPAVFSCLETVASLKFANRAKSVKNKAVVNKDTNGESALLSAYQAEIIKLREMLKKQQQQQQQQQVAGPLSGRPHLTLELQAAHQKADEENSAIVSELRQRQLEVKEANEEKAYYVERIGDLERKLISGGTRVEDTTEFKMALTRERERLREEQQEREVQIEAERKRLEHEKAAFETERKKFALRTAVLSSSAAARAKHLSPIAASTPPISTLGRPLESPQRMAAVSSRSLPSAVRHNSFLATGNEASSVRAGSSDSDSDEFEMMPARLAAGCARPTSVASSSPRTDPAIPPSYGSDADPWAPVRRAASRPQTASAPKPAADLEAEALMEYSRALQDPRTGIPLSTKRVRLTTYRQCFTGAEAAGWFMANMEGIVSTEAARSVGQQLLDLGVIFHVKGQTVYLVSDQHLYQFRGSKMAASHDRGVNAPRPSGPRASRPKSSSSLASRGSLTMSRGSSASLASFSTAMSGESPEDGSDDFMEDVDGLTANPLHLAAAAGDLATVRALVATHGPDCLDALNRTPLMYAVIGNKGKVCRALIKSHANVNARDDNGNTPLLWAACRGCRDACGVLLREGSDVEAVDLAGRSALHWSTKLKRTDILELLLRKSFRHLTNRKDDEGLTALHWAIMCAHLPHVELLLAKLADPAVGDNEGRTPLHYAVSRNTLPGLQCLIERCPAVINVADNQGRTALHMACGEGNVEIVTLLLAAVGTDPNPIDHRLTTPLHWAVVCNRPDICRILLQAGGKVNVLQRFWTPTRPLTAHAGQQLLHPNQLLNGDDGSAPPVRLSTRRSFFSKRQGSTEA